MTVVKFTNGQKNGTLKSPYSDVYGSMFNLDSFQSKNIFSRTPLVNIAETKSAFHIELATPGLRKEDFKINVEKDQLTVSAERKTEGAESSEEKKYNRREFNFHSFTRTFNLPEAAEQANIQAEYVDGILHLTVGKKEEAKVQIREISVK